MSLAASRRAWSATPETIRGSAFTLLLALADYADERNLCWPTLGTLAKKAHVKERQATDLLRELEAAEQVVIARKPGRDGGMLFAILTGLSPSQKVQTLQLFSEEKVQFLTRKGAISCKEKVQFLHEQESPFEALQSREVALDPQCNDHKNDHERSESVSASARAPISEQPEQPEPQPTESGQLTLVGLPEQPTPVPAPPSQPKKPRERKPAEPTPEQRIRRALLAVWAKGPSAANNARVKKAGDALMEFDPAVSVERIETFARRYFVRHSDAARIAAQRGEPCSPPTPEQTLGDWPRFQAWEAAQRREAEERERQPRPPTTTVSAEERARIKEIARHGWYGLDTRPAAPAPVALSARGRNL